MTAVDNREPAVRDDVPGKLAYDHRKTALGKGTPIKMERLYTTKGVHPYDEVTWEKRDIVMTNWRDGQINFEQRGVEFPDFWGTNPANIVVTKYFRGAVGHDNREKSLKELIDRVVLSYVAAGRKVAYFHSDGDADIFEHELTFMLLHQIFAFNSPVWFNVGTKSPQQVSACFILSVEDDMDAILNWYREEGLIFKGGSGAGLNLSKIRSSKELLSSGGTASGPVSFMRGADSSAGTIKSGGATRRAAKMVVLDVDHPDIVEFIETKAREEDKIRALRDAGFDMDLGGKDIVSVQYQNANNSVRVSDEFMQAVEARTDFGLRARSTGEVIDVVDANLIWDKLAQAAWECADPGIQYDDTINDWHTTPEDGRITASNPCSEYMSLDNSSCNLASLNLMKFLSDDGVFDWASFKAVVELVITAMDISICFADFPTKPIGDTTRDFRQLGIGYANLGALLMATGHAYDSDTGRQFAAAITSLMTGTAYKRSAELAGVVGPYFGYARNADAHKRVIHKHAAANDQIKTTDHNALPVLAAAIQEWQKAIEIGEKYGYRNAQVSVIAPTGTIGLMMDCDTTGLEPDLALVKFKKLVGGSSMQIVNNTVPRALKALGYQDEQVEAILEYIAGKVVDGKVVVQGKGHVVGAPSLKPEHYSVFDCAMGERSISPMGHVKLMAAIQPFISGALSKTVNLPAEATVEDVANVYFQGWKLGIKSLAIYRNNSKVGQPLQDKKGSEDKVEVKIVEVKQPVRRKLPQRRYGFTQSVSVGDLEIYLTANHYPDTKELGEVFVKAAKQGTTLSGLFDSFAVDFSMGRQYHVPLVDILGKYIGMSFEPAGFTDDPEIPIVRSVMDYIGRRLALDFLTFEERAGLNVYSAAERTLYNETGSYQPKVQNNSTSVLVEPLPQIADKPESGGIGRVYSLTNSDAPLCMTCGVKMRPAGSCYVCESCGSTSGCS